jgi:hypothetical protein
MRLCSTAAPMRTSNFSTAPLASVTSFKRTQPSGSRLRASAMSWLSAAENGCGVLVCGSMCAKDMAVC